MLPNFNSVFIPIPIQIEVGADETDTKKLFGIELAKGHYNPFQAALAVFPHDSRKALYASINWLNDPIVIASRDIYLKTLKEAPVILDKETLAAKVLKIAEEKNIDGTRYLVDARERINALKLYADIAGYTGKVEIDASTKNFTHNEMRIKIVPSKKLEEIKTIENDKIENEDDNPLKLKLIKKVG